MWPHTCSVLTKIPFILQPPATTYSFSKIICICWLIFLSCHLLIPPQLTLDLHLRNFSVLTLLIWLSFLKTCHLLSWLISHFFMPLRPFLLSLLWTPLPQLATEKSLISGSGLCSLHFSLDTAQLLQWFHPHLVSMPLGSTAQHSFSLRPMCPIFILDIPTYMSPSTSDMCKIELITHPSTLP